jgi:WD40 repeat protein/Ca2+-binding EF-hand superfamily protein
VPGTTLACTATVEGDVIMWDDVRSDKHTKSTDKTVLKVLRLHNSGITFITCAGPYVVTGGVEGHVRFMDHQLRMVAWFEELNGGPIIAVSFARNASNTGDMMSEGIKTGASTFTGNEFRCPDFVVSTANAMILDVSSRSFATADTEFQRGKLLVQGQDHPVMALAAHPSLPRLAIGGYSGNIHLWEYTTKKVLLLSIFKNMLIHSLAFDPKALFLAVGFTNGVVKILDANKLEELQPPFKPKTPDCIIHIAFSHDSQYLATADAEGCVGLYKYTHRAQDVRKPIEWVYMGRHRSHRAPITGLQFGVVPYGDAPRLVSVGEDKRLVEYNLPDTDIESGLRVRCAHKISQGAIPTGLLWTQDLVVDEKAVPRNKDGKAAVSLDMFLVCTNEYKIKTFASDTSRQCVKTVLGPTYGGPVNRILGVTPQPGSKSRCIVYSTHEKVIGIVKLPLDGNPRSAMGLLAHPLEVSAVCVSHDGKYIFSAGGRDCSVNQWLLDPDNLIIDDGRPPKEHFIDVIEGGKHGDFMKEIVDYFYYAQIRSQGEETTKKRTIEGKIPFTQVPNLMRALGYYPSEHEKQYMTFEICTRFGKPQGEEIFIDFETFIRLYVNHRPVFGINKKNVEAAFSAVGADPVSGIIDRDALFNLLRTRGEALHPMEITNCLKSLIGDDVTGVDVLEEKITAKAFAENLLGFEDYEEADAGNGMGQTNPSGDDMMSQVSV